MHCCKPHGRLNPSKQRKGEEEGEGGRGGGGGGGRTEMLESEDMAGSCCDGETSSGRERGCASDILDVCILSSPFVCVVSLQIIRLCPCWGKRCLSPLKQNADLSSVSVHSDLFSRFQMHTLWIHSLKTMDTTGAIGGNNR